MKGSKERCFGFLGPPSRCATAYPLAEANWFCVCRAKWTLLGEQNTYEYIHIRVCTRTYLSSFYRIFHIWRVVNVEYRVGRCNALPISLIYSGIIIYCPIGWNFGWLVCIAVTNVKNASVPIFKFGTWVKNCAGSTAVRHLSLDCCKIECEKRVLVSAFFTKKNLKVC